MTKTTKHASQAPHLTSSVSSPFPFRIPFFPSWCNIVGAAIPFNFLRPTTQSAATTRHGWRSAHYQPS
jgi:hypothetical protein